MATRVNTKFVVILAVVLVALVGAGVLAVQKFTKNAADYARSAESVFLEAEAALARGDIEEANTQFERAARKFYQAKQEDAKNTDYLRRFIDAHERIVCNDLTLAYNELDAICFQGAQGIHDTPGASIEDRTYLYQMLHERHRMGLVVRDNPPSAYLLNATQKWLRNHPGDPAASRYLILVEVFKVGNDTTSDEERREILEKLEGLIEKNPEDPWLRNAAGQFHLANARRLYGTSGSQFTEEVNKTFFRGFEELKLAVAIAEKQQDPAPMVESLARMLMVRSRDPEVAPVVLGELVETARKLNQMLSDKKMRDKLFTAELERAVLMINSRNMGIENHPFEGPDLAVALAKAVIEDRPEEPARHAILGALLNTQRKHAEAEEAIEAGLKAYEARKTPNGRQFVQDAQARLVMLSTLAEVKTFLAGIAKAEEDDKRFKALLSESADLIKQLSKATSPNTAWRDARTQFLSGQINFALRRNEQAISDFDKAHKYFAGRREEVEVLRHLAETHRRLGNDGKVIETYEKIVAINPTSPYRLHLIHSYLNQSDNGLLRKAELHIDNLLAQSSKNLNAIRLKANLLARQEKPEEAAKMLESHIEQHPEVVEQHPGILDEIVGYKGQAGDVDEAIAKIRERLANRPEGEPMNLAAVNQLLAFLPDRQAKLDEIKRLERDGMRPRIAEIMRKLITNGRLSMEDELEWLKQQNHAPGAYQVQQFSIYQRWNKPELAEQAFAEAVRVAPKHPMVITLRFELAIQDKEWDDAGLAVKDILGLDLDQRPEIAIADGAFMRARILAAKASAMGRGAARDDALRDAAIAYTKALKTYGFYVDGWIQLATVQLMQNNNYAAQDSLREALSLQTRNIRAMNLMARAEIATGDELRALERFEMILRLQPNSPTALNQFTALAQKLGEPGRAITQREKIRDRIPSNYDNRRELALLYASDLSYDQAKTEIDEVIKAEGKTQTNLMVLSRVLLSGEKIDEAISEVSAYLSERGSTADWRDHLLMAQTYELAKQHTQANGAYAKAMELEDKASAAATLAWARALQSRGEIESAAKIYEQLSNDRPENDTLKLQTAQVYLSAKDYKKAEAIAKTASESPERYQLLTESAMGQPGMTGIAIQRARSGVKAFPKNLNLQLQLGRLLLAVQVRRPEGERDLGEIQRIASQLLIDYPQRVEVQLLAADVQLSMGNNTKAIAQLAQILEFAPSHIAANERLYSIYMSEARKLGQTSAEASQARAREAMGIAALLIKTRPDLPMLHRRAGEAADLADMYDDSAKHYRTAFDMTGEARDLASYAQALLITERGQDAQAILENPDHTNMVAEHLILRALRGRALAMAGSPAKAEALFTNTLRSTEDPDQRVMLVNQAGLAFDKDPDRAVKIVEDVLGTDLAVPIDVELAELMSRNRRHADAAKRLKKYQDNPVSSAEIQFLVLSKLGIAQQESDQLQESKTTYEQARQIIKDNPGLIKPDQQVFLLNNLAYLLADRMTGYEQLAVNYAREALEQLPPNVAEERVALIEDTLGWALFRAKRYEEAIKVLTSSVDKYELSANLLHLGRAYLGKGEPDNAVQPLRRAAAIAKNAEDEEMAAEAEKWLKEAL